MSKICPSTGKDCEYTGCNPIGNECSLSMSKEESKPDMIDIQKPIGEFILSQKDIEGTAGNDGTYYHYSQVCTLLRRSNAELESQLAEAKELLKTLVPKLRQRELHGTANEIESFLKS